MIARLCDAFSRDRRRLAFVTTLAFIAGVFFYAHLEARIWGLPLPVVTGLIYAAIVGPVALIICAFLPSMRFLIEAVAISRLLLSLAVFTFPAVGAHVLASPLLTAMIVVSGGGLISRLLHGRLEKPTRISWKDRWFRRHPARVIGNARQMKFVHWMEDAAPIGA